MDERDAAALMGKAIGTTHVVARLEYSAPSRLLCKRHVLRAKVNASVVPRSPACHIDAAY